jgi:hypothetical protein
VGRGTPSGAAVGVGVGDGVGLAVGVVVGFGRPQVQLVRATAAIPESEAARKVRRAMPPDPARDSIGFRLADGVSPAG